MRGPAGMRNSNVGVEDLGKIRLPLFDQLLELCNLADFLESEDFILLVSIDGQTGRVIATVFES